MGFMDTIYTCPRCGIAGRWVELVERGDIAEESGWRSPTKLFHSCERRPKSWWRSLRNWLQRKPAWRGKVNPAWKGRIEVDEFAHRAPDGSVETMTLNLVLMKES